MGASYLLLLQGDGHGVQLPGEGKNEKHRRRFTLLFKGLGLVKCVVFERSFFCSPRLHLFDKNTVQIVIL